jgi:hypothetical protein
MAPDSFHHIEGTFPEPGLFRLYATDNYREAVDISDWTGRAVTLEDYDEATDEFVEVRAFDLFSSPDGAFLEALIPTSDPNFDAPAEFTAKVIFEEDFPAERFDFIFGALTTEAAADAPVSVTFGGDAPEAVPLAQRILPDIPQDPARIAVEIASRDRQIQDLIARGAFTEIFIPALQAKELALALHDRAEALPARARNDVRIAVRSLVRAAWLLDWYGDLGNKQQVNDAYDVFGSSVAEVSRVYDGVGAP